MVWADTYITGIESVDREHEVLFNQIARFEEASSQIGVDSSRSLQELFQYIEDHISTHFPEEERLQREYEYPHREMHHNMHAQFQQVFLALKTRLEREGISDAFTIYAKETIVHWMRSHIIHMDLSFGDFLKRKIALEAVPAYVKNCY